jgi:hypothetical protein
MGREVQISFLYLSVGATVHEEPWPLFFQFSNHTPIGRTPRVGGQPQGRYLHTARKQTSMPRIRFEPTDTVFKRAKIVHALDRAATVIGSSILSAHINPWRMTLDPHQFVGWPFLIVWDMKIKRDIAQLGKRGKSKVVPAVATFRI